MKLLNAFLAMLLLAASIFAVPAVALVSPAEGVTVQPPVNLEYSYNSDGTGPSTVRCTAYLGGIAVTQNVIVPDNGTTTAAYPKVIGRNDIEVECTGTGFQQTITRSFIIDPTSWLQTKVTALSPESGFAAQSGEPVEFLFMYEQGDSFLDYSNCYLEFFDLENHPATIYAGMAYVKSDVVSKITSTVPPEVDYWLMECFSPTLIDIDPHFPLMSNVMYISTTGDYPGYVNLEYPDSGGDWSDGNWEQGTFIYSYVPNGGPDRATCSLYIDGQEKNTQELAKETSYVVNVDLSYLSQGVHHWQVSCFDGALSSESRPFILWPDFLNDWSVTLHSPAPNQVVNYPTNAVFTYNRGKDTAPYSVWCYASIDGSQASNTYGAVSGEQTSIPLPQVYGNALLQIVCENNGFKVYSQSVPFFGNANIAPLPVSPPTYGGGNSGPVGSGGGSFLPRAAAQTATTAQNPVLADINTTVPSTTQVVEVEHAVLTVQAEGFVNESIPFTIKSPAGKPLTAVDIFIRVPNSTLSLKVTTDSQGKASFVPYAEGTYSYRAAGFELDGNPSTLVVAKPSNGKAAAGFDWGQLANWGLLLLAILLVLIILYSGYKITAGGKPNEPQEPQSEQTQ